jgi:putative flippase GtrA
MGSSVVSSLHRAIGQLFRYGMLGVAINLALYCLYLVITYAGVPPLAAATLCFAVGIPVSLTIHRRFTFRSGEVTAGQKLLFASGYVAGYFLQIGTLYALYSILGLPHQAAQFIAMVVVALFLFVFQKVFVFRA